MKINADQFSRHLQGGLAPVYIIYGDDIFLRNEACVLLRKAVQEQGYSEKICLNAESNFDWNTLLYTARARSFFADKKWIELSLPHGKTGQAGSKLLQQYAAHLPAKTILLIICDKLEKAITQSSWFSALDKIGITVPVWPIKLEQFPSWIAARMVQQGLSASQESIQLLAQRAAGNLLAAAQEIEKLQLIYNSGTLSESDIANALGDSARYTLFDLTDALLTQNLSQALTILNHLRDDHSEPVLLLWAITRQLRELIKITHEMAQGKNIAALLQKYNVLPSKRPLLQKALRHPRLKEWSNALKQAARIDRMIKGQETGNCWNELTQLCVSILQAPLFSFHLQGG